MDRNVFVAIALSMSVYFSGVLFLKLQRKIQNNRVNQKVEQKNEQGSIAPTINQPQIIKTITRRFYQFE